MTTLLWVTGLITVLAFAAYHRMTIVYWVPMMAGYMVLWTLAASTGAVLMATWSVFAVIVLIAGLAPLRRGLISGPLLAVFRRIMPAMSQTERDALEAGTVWWDGELFSGRPDWATLLAYPQSRLSSEEQVFIDGPVEQLCRMLDDWQISEELHDLPPEVWQFIKDHGFFGMIIPKEYGGLAFSARAHSEVVMKISTRSITAAVTVMVPNSLGPAELLMHYGTPEQKQHYLPRLARGLEVPCFALTGPEAGSDAGSIPDRGVVCRGQFDGREVLGIRLNWDKRYITLGPVATLLGLAFKLQDPDQLLGTQQDIGITLALIPTTTPGVWIGHRHMPLNIPFMNGPNRGKDVFIPMDWVIGGQAQVGNGWRMLMECLAAGRSISLPALSTGAGKLAGRATGAYARIRKQFKTPIGQFEGVEEALARIAGNAYAMDAARCLTVLAVDLGEKPSVVSAIAKYNLTSRMRQVINDAMDIQGGSGICLGPRNLIGRAYQSIPISITVEGANILTRTMITYGQGAIRCHPYVLAEMRAAQEGDKVRARADFDRALFGHIGFAISNGVRAWWLGITAARLCRSAGHGVTRRYLQQLTRMSAAFALVSDVSMLTLGGDLKRREKLSGRLADVLSQLYIVSAIVKRYEDQGCQSEDLPLMRWACDDALLTLQASLDGLISNFPNRFAAALLRGLVFPLGLSFKGPSDALGHQVVQVLLSPSAARDRLTAGVFTSRDPQQAIGRLELTLDKVVAAEPVEKKLRVGVRSRLLPRLPEEQLIEPGLQQGVIDAAEAAVLRAAIAARRDAIQVDDFPANYWQRG
ncbi:MAG: acyl-CoA dehydrogenase [Gammaproteobacteria bacterium]|nr:acyl-CoA dehydrogenase [Gammaproteobacteria bacterium]